MSLPKLVTTMNSMRDRSLSPNAKLTDPAKMKTLNPKEMRGTGSVQRMVGLSLPSRKFGAWIVAEVLGDIEGRSKLVTANLKGEQWVWTRSLMAMLDELDAPNVEVKGGLRYEPS